MRIKIKNEVWYLKMNNRVVLELPTKNKAERNFLNSIRKSLIEKGISENKINLTNRGYIQIKNLKINQKELLKKKDKDYRLTLNIKSKINDIEGIQ